VGERAEVGVGHHEVRGPVDLPDVVDPDHVVGVRTPQDPRLLQEALAHVEALGPVVGERFHGDVRAELLVAVEPDRREPSDPQPLDPLEAAEALRQGHPGMVP
jgi:hypothetical protein